jgi:hypothetical protein
MIKVFVSTMPDEVRPGERYEPVENANAGWSGRELPGWFRYSHEGLVLWTGEHSHYDDSDFYAVVWNPADGEPQEIGYATTRGWAYRNTATPDATPEVRAAYDAWQAERTRKAAEQQAAAELATPRPGKTVRVVKGRKIPVGTVAKVAWYGEGRDYGRAAKYGMPVPMRVGLSVDGKSVYTDASNVEVIAQAGPGTLPLLRVTYLPLEVCPVCGGGTGDHQWWDMRGSVPVACDLNRVTA